MGKELKKSVNQALCIFIGIIIVLCGQAKIVFAGDIIRINGSGSALTMMKPIIAAYVKTNPHDRIIMEKPLGSSGAIKALIADALDIAVVSKKLTKKDIERGLLMKAFGKTPLAIVVSNSVPAKNITTVELENIYNGKMKKWPGGETIRLVLRPQEDIDVKIMKGLSKEMNNAIAISYSFPGMVVAMTDPESNEMVSRTPGGIGTSGLCGILGEKLPLKILSLDGVMPTVTSLAKGRYPLTKDITFVTTTKSSPGVRKFLDFVYSAKGMKIARDKGVLVTKDK